MLGSSIMRTDQELLDAWRAGDDDAGEALFERHYEGLASFFQSKAEEDASDLLQRTFLLLLENYGRMRQGANFNCFLYGIARNVLYEHYRVKRRDRERFEPEADSLVDLGFTASALVAQAQETELLLQALRRIPVESQLILELYYWENMTAKEISEVLDIPEGTARTRIRRAKQLLEARLGEFATSPQLFQSTVSDLDTWALQLRAALRPAKAI